MKDQAVRLSTLVTDLLVLSRVESEEGALERRALDLRDPLADSASRLAADATGKSVEFAFEPPGEPVRIVGDEEALRQVVDNLLDNALKYTPDGGSVTLSLGTSKGTAVIEVVDTGIGIEPTHQDRIFERFYRVDKARSRGRGAAPDSIRRELRGRIRARTPSIRLGQPRRCSSDRRWRFSAPWPFFSPPAPPRPRKTRRNVRSPSRSGSTGTRRRSAGSGKRSPSRARSWRRP
jgi:hypothetical protein